MSAVVPSGGTLRQLDRRAEPEQQVTEEQVKDPGRLARILMQILRDVSVLKRRWWPEYTDFVDYEVDGTGTTKYRFVHNFGVRARFWIVDWSGAAAPNLRKDSTSSTTTLVLTSTSAGTVTVRVERAG